MKFILQQWSVLFLALSSPLLAQVQNDECLTALRVGDGVNGPFSNVRATDSIEPFPCGGQRHSDVWFFYIASCDGGATFSTCSGNTSFDTKIQVLTGTCGALTALGCNDDACASQSEVVVSVSAGTAYFVRVGGSDGDAGSFELDIRCWPPPSNDECAGATIIPDGLNGRFSNVGATHSPEPFPCGGPAHSDVWFRYRPSCSGVAVFDICGRATFDTKVQVLEGTSCGSQTPLTCRPDACAGSEIAVRVSSNFIYYLRVGGANGRQGSFDVNVRCAPPLANDECTGAIRLSQGFNGPYSNVGATLSPEVIRCSNVEADVWFRYRPTVCGTVLVSTCAPTLTFHHEIVGYRGRCGALTDPTCATACPGSARGGEVLMTGQPGEELFFRVGGRGGETGTFDLTVTEIPNGGGGSSARLSTGCGISISASGTPDLGTTVTYVAGQRANVIWIGLSSPMIPLFCSACVLGASPDIVIASASLPIVIPCTPSLRGALYYVQAAAVPSPGLGCFIGAGQWIGFSDTLAETIG